MSLPFNQETVNMKIAQIKSLPDPERIDIAMQVKADLRGWLQSNFELTPEQIACMSKWPQSMREETGFGIGTALQYNEWSLQVILPTEPAPPGTASKKHEQSVKGEYNTSTGGYTVSKTHSISW